MSLRITDPESSVPQGTQAIDVERALTRLGGDRAFLIELAHFLVQQADEELPQIERAIAQGDADALVRLAHSLKGAAASLSAEPMREAANRLETLGRNGDLDTASKDLASLKHAAEDLRKVVVGWS